MFNNEKRFNGLAISELENKTHVLEIDQEPVTVNQKFSTQGTHCSIIEFTFEMNQPVRFRLDVQLPENIANACVTLNSQVLIGFFSTVLPEDCEIPKPATCNGNHEPNHEKISTLVPGQFQSINFKWVDTDVLKFHLFYL